MVNVRPCTSAWRDRYLRHEKGAAGLLAGDEKRNLIYGAPVGRASSRRHILELASLRHGSIRAPSCRTNLSTFGRYLFQECLVRLREIKGLHLRLQALAQLSGGPV